MRGKRFLHIAAALGHPHSAFLKGWRLLTEPDEARTLTEAARWLKRASRQGCAASQSNLARVYLNANRKDHARRAFILLSLAQKNGAGDEAALGEARARLSRAQQMRCLKEAKRWRAHPEKPHRDIAGIGLRTKAALEQGDTRSALLWLRRAARRAARRGDREAQHTLGMMCYLSRSTPPHRAEAVRWLMRSARKGDPEALYNMGVLYDCGNDMPPADEQHDTQEPPLLEKFSDSVWFRDRRRLETALMFPAGVSVDRDPVKANQCWAQAAAAGLAAEKRAGQAPELTSLRQQKRERVSLSVRQAALACLERLGAEQARTDANPE